MTIFNDDNLSLNKENAALQQASNSKALYVTYQDLFALIESPDVAIVLAAFELVEASALSEPINGFEFRFALNFIKNCMVTTFPDYRQKFMKSVNQFFIRLRTVYQKDIKKGLPVSDLV